jgi:hypothetical protein
VGRCGAGPAGGRPGGGAVIGRRVDDSEDLERAGDYALGTIDDQGTIKRCVWFLLPIHEGETMFDRPTRGSGLHMVVEPPWVFRECQDGSVEIRESIACGRHDAEGEYWHGYLDEGHVWRTV